MKNIKAKVLLGTFLTLPFAANADIASTNYVNQAALAVYNEIPTSAAISTEIASQIGAAVANKQNNLSGTAGSVVTYTATAGATGSMAIERASAEDATGLATSALVDQKVAGVAGDITGLTEDVAALETAMQGKAAITDLNAKQNILSGAANNVVTYTGTDGAVVATAIVDTFPGLAAIAPAGGEG